MDIAALSVVSMNHQLRADASIKVMGNVKDMIEQQGNQLVEMLGDATQMPSAVHPSLGSQIDIHA